MNIKIFVNTLSLCIFTLILSELSTSPLLTTTEKQEASVKEIGFFEYLQNLFASMFHTKKESESTKQTPINTKTAIVIIPIAVETPAALSRGQALEKIRHTSSKIFDINDPEHISVHLENLKTLTGHLDPVIDQKTITAIHFLIENQHKNNFSNPLIALFWIRMSKEKELETSIPVTQEVFNMPRTEKLKVLQQKLTAPLNKD